MVSTFQLDIEDRNIVIFMGWIAHGRLGISFSRDGVHCHCGGFPFIGTG